MTLFSIFIAFFCMLITDALWVMTIRRIKDGSAFKASLWAGFLMLASGSATLCYVSNPWLIIPVALGSSVGTYIAVWFDTRIKKS